MSVMMHSGFSMPAAENAFGLPAGMMPLSITRNPIAGDIDHLAYDPARWLDEIIDAVPDLPDRFHRFGLVTVTQGTKFETVPREYWAKGFRKYRLRLKPVDGLPVTIRLHDVPGRGGGGKGGKSLMATIATIALLAVGTFITAGGLTPFLGTFAAAGSWGAQAIAAGVTIVGRLAITLAAKPAGKSGNDASTGSTLGQASVSGNIVQPGQPFDYVAGNAKIYPKMGSYPLVELDGEDEIVEACYQFEGPHALNQAKVEGTLLSEIPGLTFLLDDGTNPNPYRLLTRYGFQTTPNIEMKAHARDKTNPTRLANQAAAEQSLPQPAIVTTKKDPDEVWLQYLWPANFGEAAGGTDVLMSLRLQMRIDGTSSWINLPELMFHSSSTGRLSKKVVLKWQSAAPVIADQPFLNGAWNSFHTVPAQTVAPAAASGWNAHASFVGGVNLNATARVERRADGFVVYLDPAVFPPGNRWNISQRRSCVTRLNSWVSTGQVFNPTIYLPAPGWGVFDIFSYVTGSGVAYSPNGNSFYSSSTVESCILMRVATIWNRPPLPKSGNAAIELKGRNINVSQLSVEAGALVKVWNGLTFDGVATSDNPADHYFNIATGAQTIDPMPEALVNVPELGAWHAENVTAGRKVALILSGKEWTEALDDVASAGLAKARHGRLLSVTRQRNTHALGVIPRQVFNHLNILSQGWVKPFEQIPDAIRVSFRNRALDFDPDERLVIRPGLTRNEVKRIAVQEADGIADAAQIEEFFALYLAALYHRDHVFTLETWFESVACVPGDIILVNHLTLDENHASARITSVTRNGLNEITSLTLDAGADANEEDGLELVADLVGLENMAAQGVELGCCIMTATGVTTQPVTAVTATSKTISFETPFVNPNVKPGQVASLGKRGEEATRFEVTDIDTAENMFFTLTIVPETPEMWS